MGIGRGAESPISAESEKNWTVVENEPGHGHFVLVINHDGKESYRETVPAITIDHSKHLYFPTHIQFLEEKLKETGEPIAAVRCGERGNGFVLIKKDLLKKTFAKLALDTRYPSPKWSQVSFTKQVSIPGVIEYLDQRDQGLVGFDTVNMQRGKTEQVVFEAKIEDGKTEAMIVYSRKDVRPAHVTR